MWLAFIVSFMLHLKFSLLDVTFVSELSKKKDKGNYIVCRAHCTEFTIGFFYCRKKKFKAVTNLISLAFAKNTYITYNIKTISLLHATHFWGLRGTYKTFSNVGKCQTARIYFFCFSL